MPILVLYVPSIHSQVNYFFISYFYIKNTLKMGISLEENNEESNSVGDLVQHSLFT